MPKLVLIVGPQAVGKMTVGQELSKGNEHGIIFTTCYTFDSEEETVRIIKENFI